jgi:hypothetical protein
VFAVGKFLFSMQRYPTNATLALGSTRELSGSGDL